MMIIVGLGNPGEEYKEGRHNTGRIILETIAKANDFSEWKNDMKLKSLRSHGEIGKPARPHGGSGAGGEKFDFIMPETFMNNSGLAVMQVIDNPKKLKNLVVVYDDIDLPIGSLKISFNRSSGGHNGLGSVIKKIKSQEFVRVRIGVSPTSPAGKLKKPKGEEAVLKFLLGKYKEDELKEIKKIAKKVSEILVMLSAEGKEKAMSLYN